MWMSVMMINVIIEINDELVYDMIIIYDEFLISDDFVSLLMKWLLFLYVCCIGVLLSKN